MTDEIDEIEPKKKEIDADLILEAEPAVVPDDEELVEDEVDEDEVGDDEIDPFKDRFEE